jgi:dTDP-4-amino-4,6-dideoxygalactose transaminase
VSFHETKNIHCGEGGALLVNDARFVEAAEIIREKGTNRSRFFRGQVDKYTWVDLGSSYLPSELNAAFLWAQMEEAQTITQRRLALWERYRDALAPLVAEGRVRLTSQPAHCRHNGHLFAVILPSLAARSAVIAALKAQGIHAVFHYVSLHDSPGGRRFGRAHGDLAVTSRTSERLLRLPLWIGLEEHMPRITQAVLHAVREAVPREALRVA